MKDATCEGLHLKTKKKEKCSVTAGGRGVILEFNVLGISTAKSSSNTVYFYNGKVFELRGDEHRSPLLNNFEVTSDFVKFEESYVNRFMRAYRRPQAYSQGC